MLDTNTLQYLSDDQKARLVEFEKVFSSKGWEYIQGFLQQSADEAKERLCFVANWDQYMATGSRWAVFQELANLEEETYAEFERIAQQAAEDALMANEPEFE